MGEGDPNGVGRKKEAMQNLRNPKEYMQNNLKIRNKQNQIVPLILKPAQLKLYDAIKEEHAAGRPIQIIILKARQEGFSTEVEAMMFQDSATRGLVQTFIIAHRDDSTANLFNMNKLFYDCLPGPIRPMRKNSNAKELVFENPTKKAAEKSANPGLRSRIRCVTAGSGGVGRSDTLTNVHASEFAFWPGDKLATLTGILQAVPNDPNTMVIIESTANGYNEFKDLWDGAVAGTNGWRPLFFAWFEDPDYQMPVEPGTDWTDEEKELREAYHLTGEQLSWRRWAIKHKCNGDVNLFHQEYPSCPEEAFLFSGTPFFNNKKIILYLQQVPKPETVGAFSYPEPAQEGGKPMGWKWRTNHRTGYIKIWKKPEAGVPYVIGGDTAGDGSDRFIAWVIDNTTGKQVAELCFTKGSILFTRQIYCLGLWYNTALIAVETNYNSYVSKKLEEWHYPKLYIREESLDSYTHRLAMKYGFQTTSKTRPVILESLQTIMDEAPGWVQSEETLREMLHFVYNEEHRPEAEAGEHDDRVMAAAICYFCRSQQTTQRALPGGKKVEWRPDQYEDYYNADEDGKAYLIRKWGSPF